MSLLLVASAFALTLSGNLVEGVTPAQVASSRTPVTLATFRYQRSEWGVACTGSAPLTCTVSNGSRTMRILGGYGDTLELRTGDGIDIDVVIVAIAIDDTDDIAMDDSDTILMGDDDDILMDDADDILFDFEGVLDGRLLRI